MIDLMNRFADWLIRVFDLKPEDFQSARNRVERPTTQEEA